MGEEKKKDRKDYFAYPEDAELTYYDDEGNRISGKEWRDLVRREAARRREREKDRG
jgi:hypothetical protein